MRKLTGVILLLLAITTTYAQQRLEIVNGGTIDSTTGYLQREVDGELRSCAIINIQSTTELKYEIMGQLVASEDLLQSIDPQGVHIDNIYVYVNEFDSNRRLTIYAESYPSQIVDLSLEPNVTYSYMVIEPISSVVQTIEEQGESYDTLMAKGKFALKSAQYELAIELFERSLALQPNAEAYAYLSLMQYLKVKDSATAVSRNAVENAEKAYALDPSSYIVNAACGLALSQYKLGRYSESIKYFNDALTINDIEGSLELVGIDIYYRLGLTYEYLKDYENALKYLSMSNDSNNLGLRVTIESLKQRLQ